MIFYKKKIFGCFYFMKDEKANRFKNKKASDFSEAFFSSP